VRAIPDQIRIVSGDRGRVARWLNIGCGYRGVIGNFLFKIADGDVERAPGEEIGTGVVKARLSQLPVRCGAREVRKGQDGNKHDKGENDDECSAA
jgi:hypothetical protein